MLHVDFFTLGIRLTGDADIAAADGFHAHGRKLFLALVGGKVECVRVAQIAGVLL